MRSLRLLMSALLGLALALSGAAPHAAAEVALLNPKLSGTPGVAEEPGFQLSPDGSRVVYVGGLNGNPARLFSAPTDGSAAPVAFHGAGPFQRVGDFAISPDGSRIVFLFEDSAASDAFSLYSAPIGGGAPVLLSAPAIPGATIEEFAISPNSQWVVFRADLDANGPDDLFSVPVGGGAVVRLNKLPAGISGVLSRFTISPDSSRVVYRGDLDESLRFELYVSQIGVSGSTRLNTDLPVNGDVGSFAITGNTAIYRADQEVNDRTELYRVDLVSLPTALAAAGEIALAVGTPAKLSGPLVAGGSVKEFQLSPTGQFVVYRADAEQPGQDNLYHVRFISEPIRKLNADLVAGGTVASGFAISPDGQWVVYRADQVSVGDVELFAASVGGGQRLKLSGPLAAAGDVEAFAVSPDSRRVVYQADQSKDSVAEVFSAPLPPIADGVAVSGGLVPVAPVWVKLNPPLPDDRDVFDVTISPAGDRVVYQSNQDGAAFRQIYSVPIAGGDVRRLNGPSAGSAAVSDFAISADGSRVVYRADEEADGTFALYAAYEPAPSVTIAAPSGPLGVGSHELTVTLSQPMALSGVQVTVQAAGGSAVLGTDYLIGSAPALAAQGLVPFAAGETSKTITLVVLNNPERTTPRTLTVAIAGTPGVTPGSPSSLDLTLAANEVRVFLPLTGT